MADPRWTPHVTVAGIAERDGRFLLVEERISGELLINQPAGHLEDGESLLAAVEREVLEETAHRFVSQALDGIYQWKEAAAGRTFLRFSFVGSVESPAPGFALEVGIERTLWMTREEIAAASARFRSPWVLISIDDFLAGRRMPLDLIRTA